MSFVLDTSVAMARCFKDERTTAVTALLDRLVDTGAVVAQPWPIETANVLLIAERRRRIMQDEKARILVFLQDLPITLHEETADRIWSESARLAAAHDLSAYDATYLELAIRLALPLATTERPLVKAARAVGVSCLPEGVEA